MTTKALYLFGIIVLCAAPCITSVAEIANKSPETMRKMATHVVVGEITAIYTRASKEGPYSYTRYIAELQVQDIEKGDKIGAGEPIYLRYWTRFKKVVTPDTNGHRGLPKEGDRVRVYLARDAYDGFGDGGKDGGLNVIGPNGFEIIPKAEAPASAPPEERD
jgi:hypothetical protein